MLYKIRLLEQPSGGWLVEVWNRGKKIYGGREPNHSREAARGEGKMVIFHRDRGADFTVVEKRTCPTIASAE